MVINEHWDKILSEIIESDNFKSLMNTVDNEYLNKNIFPPRDKLFEVYKRLHINDIKVVILGQDPYHTKGMANGIAFSVENDHYKMPPSLRNIFKEIEDDKGIKNINKDLTPWVEQGIFLLNTTLTVEEGEANSHSKLGWDLLTTETIIKISDNCDKVAFLLWGNFAHKYEQYIDLDKHIIIKTAHPSPLSANRGFLGSRQFSKVEEMLGVSFDWRT